MRSKLRTLLVLACCAVVAAAASEPAAKRKKAEREADAEFRPDRWLQLGPAPHPVPVLFDPDDELEVKQLLGEDPFSGEWPHPRDGGELVWFGGETLRWKTVEASGPEHAVDIEPLTGEEAGLPALALLATYLTVDRWVEVELELSGPHTQCAWVDGNLVVACGGNKDKDIDDDVKLTPGTHLLVVQSTMDPRRDERWSVGVAVEPKRDGDDDEEEDDARHSGEGEKDLGPRLASSTRPERDLDILDVLDAPHVDSLALSPDGRHVALVYTRYVPGTDDAEVWVEVRRASDGGRVQSRREPGASQIGWSPDGRYLSWIGKAGEKTSALYLSERGTGRTFALLDDVEKLGGYRWSPDGRLVTYWTTDEAEPDERGIKRLEGLMDRWSTFRDKQYLHLVTVPDRVTRRLTDGKWTTSAQDFSPDGRRLLFTRQLEDYAERPYSRTELWEVDLRSFRAEKLRDFRWFNAARYSPDGSRLLVSTQPAEFGEIGENLPEGGISNSYDAQLFIWEPASGEVDAITREFDPAVREAEWSPHDGHVYLVATDRDYRRLYRYDVAARTFTSLEAGFDVVDKLALARRVPAAAVVGSSAWLAEGLAVLDLAAGGARRVEHPGDGSFRDVRRGSVEPWSFTASSGKRIEGRVYLPPDFDSQRRYPAIVYYYGGTSPVDRSFGGRYPKEWWSARGYVVYVPQPSGATGFGQVFSAEHVNNWGKTTADEIIEGTRRFLEAHPFVDPRRVGCIGASYGGFMTMLLGTETDLFAAAVAHAGISSISSYWGEGYWGYSYSSVASAEAFPWNRPDVYVEQSPLFRADRMKVPLLLTHGQADTNVPVGESDALFVALKLLGKPVEYVQIEGQDHWIVDHDKRLVWSSTIVAWFDRWLKDQPEWWTDLYP